jgi:hypothetical protein
VISPDFWDCSDTKRAGRGGCSVRQAAAGSGRRCVIALGKRGRWGFSPQHFCQSLIHYVEAASPCSIASLARA